MVTVILIADPEVVATTLEDPSPELMCENLDESWHSRPLYTNETISPVDFEILNTNPPLVSTVNWVPESTTPKAANAVADSKVLAPKRDLSSIVRD